MKKLLALTLWAGFAALILPGCTTAPSPGGSTEDFELSSGSGSEWRKVQVSGYRGTNSEVVVPKQLFWMPVTSIGQGAFWNRELKSLTIGDGVVAIGARAFENYVEPAPDGPTNGLTVITLPDSLKTIGEGAFRNNRIISLTIPRELRSIGAQAFENNSLIRIAPPDNTRVKVREIGGWAFHDNALSGELDLSRFTALREISTGAFAKNSLTKVTFPNGLRKIGENAFRDNPGLRTVEIGNNVQLRVNSVTPAFYYSYYSNGMRAGIYNYYKESNEWRIDYSTTPVVRK